MNEPVLIPDPSPDPIFWTDKCKKCGGRLQFSEQFDEGNEIVELYWCDPCDTEHVVTYKLVSITLTENENH